LKLTILVPVYNEASTIGEIIKKIRNVRLHNSITKEIIIINDGSTDGTEDILKKCEGTTDLTILHLLHNKGKSHALNLGMTYSSGDLVLIQDADLEYDPENYKVLLKPVLEEKALIVFGSRFMGTIKKMHPIIRIANHFTNITVNWLFNTHLTDVNTCHKLFKRELLKKIEINSTGFTCDAEITCKLLKKGYKIKEVPIFYSARNIKEGKKLNWVDAIKMYFGFIFYSIGK